MIFIMTTFTEDFKDMKTRALCLFFLIGLNLMGLKYVNAQKVRVPRVEISLSLNRAQTYPSQSETNFDGHQALLDLGFGLKYHFFASKKINFIPGVEYNQYRFSFERIAYSHYGSLYEVNYYLKRFTLPLAFRYSWGNRIKVFAQAGVFGEVVNDTYKETYPDQFPEFEDENLDDKIKYEVAAESNYGYLLGMGVSIPISKFRANLSLEYRHGFIPINDYYEIFKLDILRISIGFVF